MKTAVFILYTGSLAFLLSVGAYWLWQEVSAVYVVWVWMGSLTILVIADGEINGFPLTAD
jgi:hypothetical protein